MKVEDPVRKTQVWISVADAGVVRVKCRQSVLQEYRRFAPAPLNHSWRNPAHKNADTQTGRKPSETAKETQWKPYNFIGFGDIHGPKPFELLGFDDIHGPKPYKYIRFGAIHGPGFNPKWSVCGPKKPSNRLWPRCSKLCVDGRVARSNGMSRPHLTSGLNKKL